MDDVDLTSLSPPTIRATDSRGVAAIADVVHDAALDPADVAVDEAARRVVLTVGVPVRPPTRTRLVARETLGLSVGVITVHHIGDLAIDDDGSVPTVRSLDWIELDEPSSTLVVEATGFRLRARLEDVDPTLTVSGEPYGTRELSSLWFGRFQFHGRVVRVPRAPAT